MFSHAWSHIRNVALLAFLGLTLAGCEQLALLTGPTHEFVIQVDSDKIGSDPSDPEALEAAVKESIPVLKLRLLDAGVILHSVSQKGSDKLILRVSGQESREQLGDMIGQKAKLDFKLVDIDALQANTEQGIAPPGSEIMRRADGSYPMAILIDDEIVTAPILQEPILGGQLQISGDFTASSAEELAIMLSSGALPAPFEIIGERSLD